MSFIYLTPASISYLTQFILSLAITFFLSRYLRNRNTQLILLTGFFATVTLFIGLLFLDAALSPYPRLLAVYAENTVLALALVLLLQFAYRFPRLFPKRKWEAYASLIASLAYLLWEGQYMIFRYAALFKAGTVNYRTSSADYALALFFLWVPLSFLRQTTAADSRSANGVIKLWKPQGKEARGSRSFIFIFAILFVLSCINIGRAYSIVSTTFYNISLSIGILVALWLFASTYINYIPGGASVLAKLSILTLTLFMAMLGSASWMIAPAHISIYRPNLIDYQTLRFTPNASGGYDVTPIDFSFETELGERAQLNPKDETRNHKIDFSFPFYGQTYTEVYAVSSGVISMGEAFWQPNMQACCANTPAIFPLMIDLDTTTGGGLHIRAESDRLIVTWDHLPAIYQPEAIFTFQAILHHNGVFEISYNGLPSPIRFDPDATPSANPWVRGATPGEGESLHTSLDDFSEPLSKEHQAIIQNFQLDFRRYLHDFMLPLGWIVIGGSLSLLLALPALLRISIVRPLNALLTGVRHMEAGELNVSIAVQHEDEIGLLVRAFNRMAARLGEQVERLEERFKQFFEHEPDYCYMVSPEGVILDVNPAALESLGYEKEELVGKPLETIYAPEADSTVRQLLEKWREIGELINEEIVILTKGDERRTVLLSAGAVKDREGNLLHSLSIQKDITVRKQIEDQLADAYRNLRAEMEAREEAQSQILEHQRALAAIDERTRMSRDLHDGLGQVLGYIHVQAQAVQALLEKEQVSAAKVNIQQLAQASREAQADLRAHLLDLRAQSEVATPQTPASSKTFFGILPAYLKQFQERHGLEVRLWLPTGISGVLFPSSVEEQVTSIIQEALTNVAKHAQARRIDVEYQLVGNQVQISVTDDGIGFQPGELGLEAGGARAARGERLGLTIMRERAEKVGGSLEIRSAPGEGTRVIATLPRFLTQAEEEDMAEIRGLRIILADDHPLFLDGLRNLLTARGLTVVGTAQDGIQAIEKVRALRPDVAVLDLNMPGCSGIEATRAIKAEMPEVKVVILTVPELEDHLYEAIRSGASGYLYKDLQANQFCQLLIGLLRGEAALSPGIAERLMAEFAAPASPFPRKTDGEERLTPRQWEILQKVAAGLTYKEIGEALSVTEKTVKYHMGQIIERLNVENRAQAIAYLHRTRAER